MPAHPRQLSTTGYRPAQEAHLRVAGDELELSVPRLPTGQSVPVTLSGQIRIVRPGKPLRAWRYIPGAKIRKRMDERRAFEIQPKQGRYRVIISAPGHLPQTKSLSEQEGEQATLHLFAKLR